MEKWNHPGENLISDLTYDLREKVAKEAKLNNKQLLVENKGFLCVFLGWESLASLRLAPQRFSPPIKSGIVQLITGANHSLLQKVS